MFVLMLVLFYGLVTENISFGHNGKKIDVHYVFKSGHKSVFTITRKPPEMYMPYKNNYLIFVYAI